MFNFYRVEEDKKVAGVCAGLARSFDVDATIVRLVFLLSMLFLNGFGFWVYLALILFMPVLPAGQEIEPFDSSVFEGTDFRKYAGFGLIAFGIYTLIGNLNVAWLRWVTYDNLWPLILVLAGLVMLKNIVGSEKTEEDSNKDDKYE